MGFVYRQPFLWKKVMESISTHTYFKCYIMYKGQMLKFLFLDLRKTEMKGLNLIKWSAHLERSHLFYLGLQNNLRRSPCFIKRNTTSMAISFKPVGSELISNYWDWKRDFARVPQTQPMVLLMQCTELLCQSLLIEWKHYLVRSGRRKGRERVWQTQIWFFH